MHILRNTSQGMKKTSIYILSILVIAVLAISVILPSQRIVKVGVEAFSAGFKDGYQGSEPKSEKMMIPIQFNPETSTLLQPSDSIQFSDGRQLPFIINNVIVLTPANEVPTWSSLVLLLIVPLQFILFFIIVWKLMRFILNVSKERIFVSQNVKYLRQISFLLIGIAIIGIAEGQLQSQVFKLFNFTWPGYELKAYYIFPWSDFLLGLIGLLFAQIWAYGIDIKQDQELTI